MRAGFLILLAFAALWGEAALLTAGVWNAALVAPPLVSAALALYGAGKFQGKLAAAEGRRIGRAVGLWSALEGGAIFAAALVLARLGRAELIVPAIAVIVGLHFFPLARAIPQAKYYGTGAALVAAGLIAMLVPQMAGPFAASAAALALWITAIALLADARRQIAA